VDRTLTLEQKGGYHLRVDAGGI